MTTPVTDTIGTPDVSNEDADSGALFLKRWEKPDAETPPSGQQEAKDTPDDDVADAINDDADTDEGKPTEAAPTKDAPAKKIAGDDDEVTITVDGAEHKVPVKDLKRLYGQEASLTQKSQEVAQRRKEADERATAHVSLVQSYLTRAQARLKEFEGVDFMVAQTEMEPEDFKRLREDALRAYEDVQFLTAEMQNAGTMIQRSRTEYIQQNAPKALEQIKAAIPDWNDQRYKDLREYAVKHGVERSEIDMAIEPSVFILLDKAQRYDAAVAKAAAKKAALKAQKAPATKTVRTTREASTDSKTSGRAMTKLRDSGTPEDAAAAFLERWAA